ncbi:hypothetical protein [Negadavirga shengliensis]|uniref:Dolichyl-phosphate-mannose-protein mannosyltransferase n=1 Tax=Negadavirga shengliensis TaxID=1389218 RepID=A0ABV9T2W6_9BACT
MLLILLVLAAFTTLIYSDKIFSRYLITYYLGGVIFAIGSSVEVFWFFDQYHGGDQDFFISAAMDFGERGIQQSDLDFSYFFYKYFIYLVSPFNDYIIIGIFAKICFTLLWGMVLFFLFNQPVYSKKESLILLLLISIGWYYSTFVLRDGFAALGFLTFFAGISAVPKRIGWVFIGAFLLGITRIHVLLMFLPSLLLFGMVYVIKVRISPSYFVVGLFLFGVLIYKIAPIPKTIVAPLGIALLPDGESAESALPFHRRELALTYVEGDQKAKDTMIGFWIKRFPSIFYEPNPFRYFFWPFMGELGKETFFQMLTKAFSSFSSLMFLSAFLASFLIDRETFFTGLGEGFLFLIVCLFFVGSIYSIKYFGMTTRIYYGFLTGFLTLFYFKPLFMRDIKRHLVPISMILVFINLIYFVIKPHKWIWEYI